MKKTMQLAAALLLLMFGLGTVSAAENCPSNRMEGKVCLPNNFPAEAEPGRYTLNLTQGHTQISQDVFDLHMLILWICVAVGVGVFGVMFYSIYHHRKSKGHVAAQFHENTLVEIIWTIIPAIILVAMAIPATKTMMEMDDVKASDMTIKVTGWQWKWEYDYLGKDISFFSVLDEESNKARKLGSGVDVNEIEHYLLKVDKPLVIPTKTKIRFVFTAADVLHSWWVPDLGWKKDAIPGFINEAWTYVKDPGVYRGQCTELCGKDHAFMPVVVVAMDQPDYDNWVKVKKIEDCKSKGDADMSHDELVAKGKDVYATNCATCHMPDGVGVPGAFPALKGSKVVNGDINAQATLVVNGKNAMPAFGKQLSASDIAAAIAFTRNALGNSKGDEIQPKAIKAIMPVAAASDSCGGNAVGSTGISKSSSSEESKDATGSNKPAASNDPKLAGQSIYETNCIACHQKDGSGMPPMFPALKGSSVVNGDINAQAKLVINGKGSMPAFGEKLSSDDLAKVITFTRNALGNSKGDSISTDEIAALMKGAPAAQVTKSEPVKTTQVKTPAKAALPVHKVVRKTEEGVTDIQFAGDKFYPQKRYTDVKDPFAKQQPNTNQGKNVKVKPYIKSTGLAKGSDTLETLATHGKGVFEKNCQSCHQKEGVGMPPMFPALQGSMVVTGNITNQIQLMMKGKGAMPAFNSLSAKDFAAVLAYTRNKIGSNKTGDFKTTAEIQALQASSN